MPSPATLDVVNLHWVSELGCSLEDVENPRTVVVQQGKLAGYQGVMLFRRGPSCIVSTPAVLLEAVELALGHCRPEEVFRCDFLGDVFGGTVDRIIGPAWYGYADLTDFRPSGTWGTRLLLQDDDSALRRLAEACSTTEWEHSAIEFDRQPIFGCFAEDSITAAATLRYWGEQLLDVGVVTHPLQRGKGYGKAVVSAATSYGLATGSVVQYRTLQANTPAVAVARSLGYQEYAATIAVRLSSLHLYPT